MRLTTCRQTSLPLAPQYRAGDRLHRGYRGLLLAPMHFGLPGDRLYQLAQARPHNVLHFLVITDLKNYTHALFPLPISPPNTHAHMHCLSTCTSTLTHVQTPIPVPQVPPPYTAVASPHSAQPQSLQQPSLNGPMTFNPGSAPPSNTLATAGGYISFNRRESNFLIFALSVSCVMPHTSNIAYSN